MPYELFYWPSIQGRGEFVRLALEEAGAPYVDVAREHGAGRGVKALMAMLNGDAAPLTPFAPPFLRDGEVIVSHVANILAYLGPKLGLAPKDEPSRLFAHGLQLTITDFVAEVHDTHHPISTDLYYEDQKSEAKARAAAFLAHRVPKYLGYFERVLNDNPSGPAHAVGADLTTVDLSLFQVWAGHGLRLPARLRRRRQALPGAGFARRRGRRAPQYRALSRLRAADPVQRVRRLPPLSGARSDGGDEEVGLTRRRPERGTSSALPRHEHHPVVDRIEKAGRRFERGRAVGHRLVDRLHDIGAAAPEPETGCRQGECARPLRLEILGGLGARRFSRGAGIWACLRKYVMRNLPSSPFRPN